MIRITAYGFLTGTMTMFASSLTSLPTSLIIQGGALAILGWTVWYMLAKAFPAILKAAKEERAVWLKAQEEERKDFLESQEDTRREFRESLSNITNSLDCLTAALLSRQKP